MEWQRSFLRSARKYGSRICDQFGLFIRPEAFNMRPMLDFTSSTVMILFSAVVGLLALLLAVLLGVARTLRRIERRISESDARRDSVDSPAGAVTAASGGNFESFLREDSSRAKLPKSEQFAAYRRWRQEKGLNWRNS